MIYFENENTPKPGDFVLVKLCRDTRLYQKETYDEIESVIHILLRTYPNNIYGINYFGCWNINKHDVYAFSKNKVDLEQILSANKYNL